MVNLSLYNLIKFQMTCNSKVKFFYKIIFLYIVTGEVGRQAFEEIQLSTHGFQGLQVRKQDIGSQSFVPSVVCKVDKTEKNWRKCLSGLQKCFIFILFFFLQNTNLFICMVAKTRISQAEFIEIDTTNMYIVYYFDNHSRYI